MREIALTKGAIALIDDEDFDLVGQYSWHLQSSGYAANRTNGTTIYMHRLIMNAPAELEVDHREKPRTDNRRSNLRLATDSQQLINRPRPIDAKSPFRGVRFHRQSERWAANIKSNCRTFSLGYYATAEDAARAYNAAACILHGEFAMLNPIAGPPPRQSRGISGYRGVYRYNNSGLFKAVSCNQLIGVFADPEDAAMAYDADAIKRRGLFARVNFPLDAIKELCRTPRSHGDAA